MKEGTNTRATRKTASKKAASKVAVAAKARAVREARTDVMTKGAATKKTAVKRSVIVKATTKSTVVAVKGAKTQHVIPLGNGWIVKGEKAKVVTAITDNRQQAITIATSIARSNRSGIIIHNKAGQMVSSKSFAGALGTVKSPRSVASKSKSR